MAINRQPKTTKSRLKTLYNSLSVRLFFWLLIIMVLVFISYAYFTNQATYESWREMLQQSADRTSETIKRATHYGMLLNQKEDVHRTIRMIAKGPGVDGIRIYDKKGTIIFSSDSSEIGQSVNLKAEGCVICHDSAEPLQSVPTDVRARVYRGPDGGQILGLINPIENDAACSAAECHAHPPDQTILGVLDVKLSMAYADRSLMEAKQKTLIAALLMALLIGVVSAIFIYRMVRRPVKRLINGTQRIANGDLNTRIEVYKKDEIGELATAFNYMTRDLRKAQEITEEKTEELNRAHRQIVHMEKMASIGKLAATVAHELNNPIAGILNYAKLVSRDIGDADLDPAAHEELARYLNMIQKESSRCGDIVHNLLLFTRRSGAEFAQNHLNQIIERALMLVRHHLEMAGIQLESKPLEGDDLIVCDADQLQQALVAMFVNAVESMHTGGTLSLGVGSVDNMVHIDISDTGTGIPPEVLPEIFEPFFSTKDKTTGVGLGLSVAYGILQRHGGNIEVESKANQGTTFRVLLPKEPAQGTPEGNQGSEVTGEDRA